MIDTLNIHERRQDFGGMKRINSNPNTHGYFLECKHNTIFRQTEYKGRKLKVLRIEDESIEFNEAGTEFVYKSNVIVEYED